MLDALFSFLKKSSIMNLKKSLKNILVAGAVLVGATSCTSDFEEINTNPNSAEALTPAQFFHILFN